ncbi:MAG TPA: DNA internalization-related competence protein ComEC/Rec2 [Gammaproteobacteria bacterium]|nr:DNA internalization-related competence protein ComEC/Rec2 [Gammaproteobacteria bacterium]
MIIFSGSFLLAMSQLLWIEQAGFNVLIFCFVGLFAVFLLRKKLSQPIFLLLCGLFLGSILANFSAINAKRHQYQDTTIDTIEVVGTIVDLPVLTDMGRLGVRQKFAFAVENSKPEFPLRTILVSWYNNETILKAGQSWVLEVKPKPIHGFKNPGSFDYAKWLFRQGYDATATVRQAELFEEKTPGLLNHINRARSNIADLISENISNPRVEGLIRALTIGDRSLIDFEDSQMFQQTGTAHIIAISGLHIGLVALIGIFIGRLFFAIFPSERFNRFKFEAVFTIFLALIYTLLAGASIPTLRALIMVFVFAISPIIKRNISRWISLSIALMLVLLFDPFSVLDVGFWFSFTAVAILIYVFTGRKPYHSKLISITKAQLMILIGLMPLMLVIFNQINLLTPIINLIILPLVSLLLIPTIMFSLLITPVSSELGGLAFSLTEFISEIFLGILEFFKDFDYLVVSITSSGFLIIIGLIVFSILVISSSVFRWRWFGLFLLLPVFIKPENSIEDNEFSVNVLDVGQGLSIVVRTKDKVLLYDTGAKYESGFSMANAVVIPFLNYSGITNIDKVILSHLDNDHAGGIEEILKKYPNAETLSVDGNYEPCQSGENWKWNNISFTILSPFEITPYLGNNSSCVIHIQSEYGSVLLTADIEVPVEYRLTHHLETAIASDVLIVPHHGSRTSSDLDFIQAVNPKFAINSSGFMNQFNHPHPQIKQIYLEKGIEFYDTQEKGRIEIKFLSEGVLVESYKGLKRNIWDL